MTEDALPEWTSLADLPYPLDAPDAPLIAGPADRRLFNRLQKAQPDWTVVERAHEPFGFKLEGMAPAFRPPGKPPRRNDFDVLVLPQEIDWRARTQIGAALDQRACQCCSAFAIAAIMTDLATIRAGSARAPLSPGHLHWCIGGANCQTALAPDALANAATQHLVALLQPNDFPFNSAQCPIAHGLARLSGTRSLFSAADAGQALQSGPILGVMDLYDDFWSHYGGGVYRRRSNTYLNSHSIEIVGYDGQQQCWFVKNSEGPGWGEGGFARIAFGECRIFTPGGNGGLALQLA